MFPLGTGADTLRYEQITVGRTYRGRQQRSCTFYQIKFVLPQSRWGHMHAPHPPLRYPPARRTRWLAAIQFMTSCTPFKIHFLHLYILLHRKFNLYSNSRSPSTLRLDFRRLKSSSQLPSPDDRAIEQEKSCASFNDTRSHPRQIPDLWRGTPTRTSRLCMIMY